MLILTIILEAILSCQLSFSQESLYQDRILNSGKHLSQELERRSLEDETKRLSSVQFKEYGRLLKHTLPHSVECMEKKCVVFLNCESKSVIEVQCLTRGLHYPRCN